MVYLNLPRIAKAGASGLEEMHLQLEAQVRTAEGGRQLKVLSFGSVQGSNAGAPTKFIRALEATSW
eukprot:6442144-Prymnesium_polylepis.1